MRLPAAARWRPARPARLATPTAQVLGAAVGMVVGAALIGLWMVGVVLIVGSVAVAADGLLRQAPDRRPAATTHEDVLERYRRAR